MNTDKRVRYGNIFDWKTLICPPSEIYRHLIKKKKKKEYIVRVEKQ